MLKDMLGNSIQRGDTIAYPVIKAGKGIRLSSAQVVDLIGDSLKLKVTREDGSEYNFSFVHINRCVVCTTRR